MPNLPLNNDCCGCAACVDSCAKGAISLVEDENSFYSIKINPAKCVDCGLCEKRCHILHQEKLQRHEPQKVQPIAAWSTNDELIKHSATGAVFAQVAYNMLQEGNTFVYGAALQADSSVRHIEISSIDQLIQLQNSKYQQSYLAGIYKQVRQRLKEGARVLFSGVPCQVSALYANLNLNEELMQKLYTIEVLCHGVPCNDLHRTALKYEKADAIVTYRTKGERGWLGNNFLTYHLTSGSRKTLKKHQMDFLFRSYLTMSYIRPNCYSCKYASIFRVSDLTIGDFWGWEKSKNAVRYQNKMGTSLVLRNSSKGIEMMKGLQLHVVDTTWDDILPLNQNLFMPTNDYDFIGSYAISCIKHLPLCLKIIIYQKGFSNTFLNKISIKILGLVFGKKRKLNRNYKLECLNKTLQFLKR